ncbi:Small GTPase like protein [Aduncisulcus paluster]|uniref:Small GTPase like protein n=1 Tax=Aduncisulcus paluster TaxID=2918883 RepID=A0ABQ5JT16_9EUKA|nr:Small GTPase like protein [Aduncisulcus paluster]
MVGTSQVGKTSICLRLKTNTFIDSAFSTLGTDFMLSKLKSPDGRVIQARIFDTSGQERFSRLVSGFFHGSDLAIFVVSFDEIESLSELESKVDEVDEHCDPPPLKFLVLNKIDLPGALDGSWPLKREDVEAASEELGFDRIYLTSAKTGEGISELFEDVAKELLGLVRMDDGEDSEPHETTKLVDHDDYDDEDMGKGCCCK